MRVGSVFGNGADQLSGRVVYSPEMIQVRVASLRAVCPDDSCFISEIFIEQDLTPLRYFWQKRNDEKDLETFFINDGKTFSSVFDGLEFLGYDCSEVRGQYLSGLTK